MEKTDQKRLIEGRDWDCLIVLDACRYDYFEEVYGGHLEGELRKTKSVGSNTDEWLLKVFGNKKYKDSVYVSSNPRINSKGIEVVEGFDATKCFHEVTDVWDGHWSEDFDTVLPGDVSKETLLARAKYPDKRIISHFMQPHFPYLSLGSIMGGISGSVNHAKKRSTVKRKNLIDKTRGILGKLGVRFLGKLRVDKLRDYLNIGPSDPVRSVAKIYGKEGLRKAYAKNLESALVEVENLIEKIPGKIVVTSDHGEYLGENGFYSHANGYDDVILREVPWLRIPKK